MASHTTKPVILFVHGAWSPPCCYQGLKDHVEAQGYEFLIPQLPTVGVGKTGLTWEADVARILEVAEPLFNEGREVVLVAHSYGGIPSAAATRGQGVEERARDGKKGGFRQIIFVAAFALPRSGLDLVTCFGGRYHEWQNAAVPYTGNHSMTLREGAKAAIYGDYDEAAQQQMYEMLLPHSQDAFETPCDFVAADIVIPKTYVVCERDSLVLPALQEQLVASIPGMKEVRIDAGHHPFVSRAKEVADIIVASIKEVKT